MSPVRVARVPYLNSVPFYADLELEGIELVELAPRALGEAAARGRVDAGPMSLVDSFREPAFEPLGGVGIAADGPAHSVLLFCARPPEELDGATLGITSETSTSYPLLRLLLEGRYRVRPSAYATRRHGPEPGDDGILLIGNAALRRAARAGLLPGQHSYDAVVLELPAAEALPEPFRYVVDLGACWNEWQGLPFVFARWVARRDLEPGVRPSLAAALVASVEAALRDLGALAAAHGAEAGLTPEAARIYLTGFNYKLGSREQRAIQVFRGLLESEPWWESAVPRVLEGRKA